MLLLRAAPLVSEIHTQLKHAVDARVARGEIPPQLAVVLVGEDPASQIYVQRKIEACKKVGFAYQTLLFPKTVDPKTVHTAIQKLNHDPSVHGILIQRPLPKGFDLGAISTWVDPHKDVDGFHPENVGRLSLGMTGLFSCTPLGIIRLLDFYKIPLAGKTACVIGRSSIVGRPMAQLLLQRDCTVLQCHSQTQGIQDFTRVASIVIVAAGQCGMVTRDWIHHGATVIDVGMHRDAQGKVCGDVDFASVSQVAGALTPVPGGVGPMTIAMLLENTLRAAGG